MRTSIWGTTAMLAAVAVAGCSSSGNTLPGSTSPVTRQAPGSASSPSSHGTCPGYAACVISAGYELAVRYVEPFGAQFNAAPSQPATEVVVVAYLANLGGSADNLDPNKAQGHLLTPQPSNAYNPEYVLTDAHGSPNPLYLNGCNVANGDGNTHLLMNNNGFITDRDLAPHEQEGPVDMCFAVTSGTENAPTTLTWTPNSDTAATVKLSLPAASVPAGLPTPPAPVPTYNSAGDYAGPSPNGTPEGQNFTGSVSGN